MRCKKCILESWTVVSDLDGQILNEIEDRVGGYIIDETSRSYINVNIVDDKGFERAIVAYHRRNKTYLLNNKLDAELIGEVIEIFVKYNIEYVEPFISSEYDIFKRRETNEEVL